MKNAETLGYGEPVSTDAAEKLSQEQQCVLQQAKEALDEQRDLTGEERSSRVVLVDGQSHVYV